MIANRDRPDQPPAGRASLPAQAPALPEGEPSAPAQNKRPKPIALRIDEQTLSTSASNTFRAQGTPEELILDFGLGEKLPLSADGTQTELRIPSQCRVVMNYYAAKRLASLLTRVIHRHEQRFGALDVHPACLDMPTEEEPA